ncbi:MAG: NUDIX domain-containing protein [Oceanipulchritudo sp.]
MSYPPSHFSHCPRCGDSRISVERIKLLCEVCGFTYFFNPTIGTAAFIENEDGEILLITRGKEPARGRLAPPGGFADYDESAEEALTREVKEETGLTLTSWAYLTSGVNHYAYAGITYPVIDFFYTARVPSGLELERCERETRDARWHPRDAIDPEGLAFPSMQQAFRLLIGR